MNKAQLTSIIVTPMVTGCISFIASFTIIVSILQSNLKLSTTYRRLVFMISVFDVFQSLSQLTSAISLPANTGWLAIGNDLTCSLRGFFDIFGSVGAIFYTLALTLYFFLVIQFEMNEDKIQKRFEPFLHAFPVLYATTISVYIFATKNYNPAGPICWIGSRPENCRNDPDVDCESTGDPDLLKWMSMGVSVFVSFFLNCVMLVCMCCKVLIQTKKSQAYRSSWVITSPSHLTPEQDQVTSKHGYCPSLCCSTKREAASPLAARLSRPSQASIHTLKDLSIRAIAYIVGFLITYMFPFIYRCIEIYSDSPPPFTIIFLARFFFPLQGLFNVLVYTYPHVSSYRRRHTSHSWFQAIWEVVRTGGDSDQRRTGRSGRGLSRKSQKNLFQRGKKKNSLNLCQRGKKKNSFGASLCSSTKSNIVLDFPSTYLDFNAKTNADENTDHLKLEAGEETLDSIISVPNHCSMSIPLSLEQNSKLEIVDDEQLTINDKDDVGGLENAEQ